MPVFDEKQEELEHYETMMGVPRGRLAVTMDMITDAMALVGQHGVYCQSQRWPGKPVLDIQLVMKGLTDAKELIQSVMAELSKQAAKNRLNFQFLSVAPRSAPLVLARQLLIEKLRHQFETLLWFQAAGSDTRMRAARPRTQPVAHRSRRRATRDGTGRYR